MGDVGRSPGVAAAGQWSQRRAHFALRAAGWTMAYRLEQLKGVKMQGPEPEEATGPTDPAPLLEPVESTVDELLNALMPG
eukprot:Skav202906  [mRNA]  locus=scaffold1565:29210:31671:+ [translate_table: standard]